ncbi:MAG: arylesterase [Sphingomonadaceae bacterium]|nr:arylesterase [Sphingomonadaceae bacterium]
MPILRSAQPLSRAAAPLRHWLLAIVALMGLALPAAAQQPSPAAEPVILALGDSLTAGYQLPSQDGFTAQLERALRARGRAVRVHNAGVSGDTSSGGRQRLQWVLNGLKQKPALAIVELGANDMLRGIDPSVTRANLDAILAEFRKRGIPVVLAGMFSSPTLGVDYVDRFNRLYPDLAKKHGATLYPFFLKGVAFNPPLLLPDGLHPNARGVDVIVRNMLPTIEGALTKANAPAVRRG